MDGGRRWRNAESDTKKRSQLTGKAREDFTPSQRLLALLDRAYLTCKKVLCNAIVAGCGKKECDEF